MQTTRREFFLMTGAALAAGTILGPVPSALAAIDPRAKILELLEEMKRLNVQSGSDAFVKASDVFVKHVLDYSTPFTWTLALQEEVNKIFLGEGDIENCSRPAFGAAIMRQALAVYRLPFEPSRMKYWNKFSYAYQDLILAT